MPLNAERRKALSKLVPEGAIVTRQWLLENQFDRHAIDNLVKTDQLHVISYGIYGRGELPNSWEPIIYALQAYHRSDCVVGGLTALELQGLAHYLPLSKQKQHVQLYTPEPLPKWVTNFSSNLIFIRHNSSEVFKNLEERNTEFFTKKREWRENLDGIIISIPERAMLETLLGVPDKLSFDHANELMQGMTSFSPRVVQSVLEQCTNVKCKRLFLWLSERQNYPWFAKLNLKKIDLGAGNRMLVKGGKLNKKYHITVPSSYE